MCDPLEHCSNIVTCNEIGKFTKKIIAKLYRKSNKYVECGCATLAEQTGPFYM